MTLMATSMAAMMLPTAVPFFMAARRPDKMAVVAAIYTAVWAALGAAAWFVMSQVMLPTATWVPAVAIAFALTYLLMPWARVGARRCQEMCRRPVATAAWKAGLTYTWNCFLCSAGVMVAVLVVGMSNLAWMAAASAVILIYKATGIDRRSSSQAPASRGA
jgi:predicted metal-binding membrane protein